MAKTCQRRYLQRHVEGRRHADNLAALREATEVSPVDVLDIAPDACDTAPLPPGLSDPTDSAAGIFNSLMCAHALAVCII